MIDVVHKSKSYNLLDIANKIMKKKFLFFSLSSFFALASVIIALLIPNTYTSKAILAPVNQDETLSSTLSRFSGLAGLAGVNLPSGNGSKSIEAIERLNSLKFFSDLLDRYIFRPDLMAAKKWDSFNNVVIYDSRDYLRESDQWIRKVDFPKKQIPTSQEAYEEFLKSFSVIEDKSTGFITITMSHYSPFVAKNWLDGVIKNLDNTMRQEDKIKAINSIDYLNQQILQTSLAEIRNALSDLIKQQTQTLMLVEANENYIFKVIEPPYVPEMKSGPSRALICILGTLLGSILSIFLILVFGNNKFFGLFSSSNK